MFFSWARMRFHRLRSFPTSWMTQWGHLGRRIRCRSRYAGDRINHIYARLTVSSFATARAAETLLLPGRYLSRSGVVNSIRHMGNGLEQLLSSERHDPAASEDRPRRTSGGCLRFARIFRVHRVKLRLVSRIN